MASPAPATLSDKLAVIHLNVTRLREAASKYGPEVLGPVDPDIHEMYLLSVGAAEYVDDQTDQAVALASAGAVAS